MSTPQLLQPGQFPDDPNKICVPRADTLTRLYNRFSVFRVPCALCWSENKDTIRRFKQGAVAGIDLSAFISPVACVAVPEGLTAVVSRSVYTPRPRIKNHGASPLPSFSS